MAATYIATVTGAIWASSDSVYLSLFNGAGSGKIIYIKRIWFLSCQTAAVTGLLQTYHLYKITTNTSGGAPVTVVPVKYDTNSPNLPAQITCKKENTTNGTATLLRTMRFSGDEPAVGTFSLDELQTIVPLNVIWDVGYGNSSVQPLTLREGEGVSIYSFFMASQAGNFDVQIEFITD